MVRQLLGTFVLSVRLTVRNIKQGVLQYLLGFAACFLVVFVVALLVTLLSKAPLIFVRLAEMNNGEIDLKLDAGWFTGFDKVNYTLISSLLEDNPDHRYHTPRIFINSGLLNPNGCLTGDFERDHDLLYRPRLDGNSTDESPLVITSCAGLLGGCPTINCPGSKAAFSRFTFINLTREEELGIGRSWIYNEPLEAGEVYLSGAAASALQVGGGDLFYASFNISWLVTRDRWVEALTFDSPNKIGK